MTSRKRSAEDSVAQSKKAKTGRSLVPPQTDDNGDKFWEVSKNRRVTLSNFRGKNMVSIREYYEKDGKALPGKKGISLPMDQFSAFITLLPEIEEALVEAGEHPRGQTMIALPMTMMRMLRVEL
ncbi:hypothetical protein N7470_001503 [Penicillium chermesinum]|nr:hypothetical protein N7470_001503 [Penicillium chermesinum]